MFSQRALQTSMRRLASANPSALSKTSPLMRLSAPAAIATGQKLQYRPAATTSATPEQGYEILAKQRLNRPVSPHLAIYRPQITWYGSITNRITGCILSGTMYVYGAAYLVAPMLGWHLESASVAAAFATLPIVAKVLIKTTFAWPLAYHSINGIRHLVWDTGATITNKQVIYTGWTVVGLSVLATLGLVAM